MEAFDADSTDPDARLAHAAASGVQAWFMALLGRYEEGVRQAEEALATLAELPDLTAYVMGAQFQCIGLMYLGRTRELHDVSLAAIRRAEEAGDEWLAVENKTYLAASEIYMGHLEEATRLSAESEVILRARGAYRRLSMNLVAKAILANREGRHAAAIEILNDVVASAGEIGFRRMTQMGLERLGEAYLGTGDLEAADNAYLNSLAMSEEMGLAIEIAGQLVRIARVRARMVRPEEVVAILASVLADPISRHMTIYEDTTVEDMATELLDENGWSPRPAHLCRRSRPGTAQPLEVTAKELLAGK